MNHFLGPLLIVLGVVLIWLGGLIGTMSQPVDLSRDVSGVLRVHSTDYTSQELLK